MTPVVHATARDAAAATDGAVEVLIGMRWEHLWRLGVHPWVPSAFLGMLRARDPELLGSGLAVRARGPAVVQRWSSARALDAWARSPGSEHGPAWGRFARHHGAIGGWGIWHEVRAAR